MYRVYQNGDDWDATDANAWMSQGVPRFTSTSARNAAIEDPEEDQLAIVDGVLYRHNGSSWVTFTSGSGATGPTGPAGATGSTGATGPAGAVGATGPSGSGGGSSVHGGGSLAYFTGRYIDGLEVVPDSTSSSGSIVANVIYLTPIEIYRTVSIDAIAVWCATSSGGNMRMGIYASSSTTGLPTTVVKDGGTAANATGAAVQVTFTAISLSPGLYWRAIISDSASQYKYVGSGQRAVSGISAPAATTTYAGSFTYGGTTGALPDLTGVTLGHGGSNSFFVWLRVV